MRRQIKNNIRFFLLIITSILISNENLVDRQFQPSGRIDAMISDESQDLMLIQFDLKNDSLYQIIDINFPELELLNGPASYHRIVPADQLSRIETHITPEIFTVLDNNYQQPDESRLYWVEIKQGGNTYGTYTQDEAIEYTCSCIGDQTNDCVKLGYDESWYNPFDYYGEAWWAFTPPSYDYIQEIRVTVRGAQCDDLPLWSETYMGLKDDNGNWSNDYELSVNYADNLFIVPSTWNQGMLMPTVGSEDNYVIDFVKFEFFYSCISPDEAMSIQASDGDDCSVVNIDWEFDSLSNSQGFQLFKDGDMIYQSDDFSESSFIDYSAQDGVQHEYCILTYNDCEASDLMCNTGYVKTAPSSASNVQATDGDELNQISVTWNEVGDVDGYKIYRDGLWFAIVYPHLDLQFTDEYVDPGVIYNYCIESYNECGESSWACDEGFSGAYLGDSNFDGSIDVLDVVTLVNFILLIETPNEDQFFWVDMNQDGSLNVQDIVLIVNIILN